MDNYDQRARQLVDRSLAIIASNQSSSGAYVACPNFEQYRYCWFRDGAFISHAMSVMDQRDSATRFHDWAANTVIRHADLARACVARSRDGRTLDPTCILNTRYTLDGADTQDEWPNFQLDGFGTWLWAAVDHLSRTGDATAATRWRPALAIVADYLGALWRQPNYDCWEEFGNRVHITTLLAIHGGLRAFGDWSGSVTAQRDSDDIRRFVLASGVCDGHLRKFAGQGCEVDAALIGACVPYSMFEAGDPIMQATVRKIEADLRHGGVHRYGSDSYYGGGEWILLTAWLGWHYARSGELDRANGFLKWVVDQADANWELPEQVPANLIAPEKAAEWLVRWGDVAKPLLWSHAQFLILWRALRG